MADYTKQEIQTFAVQAPVSYFTPNNGAIADGDGLQVVAEKLDGKDAQLSAQIGTIQVGNNLFNYYNFR